MTFSQIDNLSDVIQIFNCEFCHSEFDPTIVKYGQRFCSRKCCAKLTAMSSGASGWSSDAKRLIYLTSKFGEIEAEKMITDRKNRRSLLTVKNNTGRVLSEETKQKTSLSCTGIPNVLKGKTFEEFYGIEKAKQLGDQHSKKLKEGFASGRLSSNGRGAYAPIFRGVRLRSKLEQRAIEFLEKRDGLVFLDTLLYEDKMQRFQWFDESNKSHSYQPDLYDIVNDVIYEVKPAWKVDRPDAEMNFKQNAVVDSGRVFRYLTDRDIKRNVTRN